MDIRLKHAFVSTERAVHIGNLRSHVTDIQAHRYVRVYMHVYMYVDKRPRHVYGDMPTCLCASVWRQVWVSVFALLCGWLVVRVGEAGERCLELGKMFA